MGLLGNSRLKIGIALLILLFSLQLYWESDPNAEMYKKEAMTMLGDLELDPRSFAPQSLVAGFTKLGYYSVAQSYLTSLGADQTKNKVRDAFIKNGWRMITEGSRSENISRMEYEKGEWKAIVNINFERVSLQLDRVRRR